MGSLFYDVPSLKNPRWWILKSLFKAHTWLPTPLTSGEVTPSDCPQDLRCFHQNTLPEFYCLFSLEHGPQDLWWSTVSQLSFLVTLTTSRHLSIQLQNACKLSPICVPGLMLSFTLKMNPCQLFYYIWTQLGLTFP